MIHELALQVWIFLSLICKYSSLPIGYVNDKLTFKICDFDINLR